MTTREFWKMLNFSYVATFSFNRGEKLLRLQQAAKALFKTERMKLLTAPSAQLPAIRAHLRQLESPYSLGNLALTEGLAAFHITASPVAVIEGSTLATRQLGALLSAPLGQQLYLMCGPIYRDALAFYDDQHNLLRVLNICFSCDRMLTDTGEEVQADASTYQNLKHYLTQLGHPITSAD